MVSFLGVEPEELYCSHTGNLDCRRARPSWMCDEWLETNPVRSSLYKMLGMNSLEMESLLVIEEFGIVWSKQIGFDLERIGGWFQWFYGFEEPNEVFWRRWHMHLHFGWILKEFHLIR